MVVLRGMHRWPHHLLRGIEHLGGSHQGPGHQGRPVPILAQLPWCPGVFSTAALGQDSPGLGIYHAYMMSYSHYPAAWQNESLCLPCSGPASSTLPNLPRKQATSDWWSRFIHDLLGRTRHCNGRTSSPRRLSSVLEGM